jgi:hypothetical protein
MSAEFRLGLWRVLSAFTIGVGILATLSPVVGRAQTQGGMVTFAKDVAPILQARCQACHRPGSMAPMSLLTYEDVRPWVRGIKLRVSRREMPPWHLDRNVGIQKYKNDPSLSDAQIDTLVKWVDTGAPLGDIKDLPRPVQWPPDEVWSIGKPDHLVKSTEHVMYANGPDWWVDYEVDSGLTEDRWIKAVETKPSRAGRRIVHHGNASVVAPDGSKTSLSEYAVGKYGDIFPDGTGRLIKAGSKISFNMHYHAVGEEIRDSTTVAFIFYPKGVVPKYKVVDPNMGGMFDQLDIPPNTVVRHDSYFRVPKPARLISFQPHMHMRGKAQTMEAIYPDGKTEVLSSVDHFDFNWQVSYVYQDDVAPLLPAGTVLHLIALHDNTAANKGNPDPTVWVGWGNRSIDDMLQCHMDLVYLDEADFQQQVSERKAKLTDFNER